MSVELINAHAHLDNCRGQQLLDTKPVLMNKSEMWNYLTLMHTSMVVEDSSCWTESQWCCSGVMRGLRPSFSNFISLY